MKVFIISLEDRQDNRDLLKPLQDYFTQKNIPFQFYIQPRPNDNFLQELLDARLISWLGVGFRKSKKGFIGEMGCFTNHMNLWKQCMNDNEDYLIMEDSSVINFDLLNKETFDSLADITFYNQEFYQNESMNMLNGFGITCYKISPRSAKLLLKLAFPLTAPLDLQVRQLCNQRFITYSIGNQFVKRNNDIKHSTEENVIGIEALSNRQSFTPVINRMDELNLN